MTIRPLRPHAASNLSALIAGAVLVLLAGAAPRMGSAQEAARVVSGPEAAGGFAVEEASIADIQQALLAGRITTVELVEQYLRRIKAYNGPCVNEPEGRLGPITTIPHAGQINALSTLNLRPAARATWGFDETKARTLTDRRDADPAMPDALEVAAAQDARLEQTGRLVGPLHGVVMAIKDQFDTFDLRTTSGADADYANDRPPDDATVVARLRAAGAIILAKANMAEYAVDGARSSFGGTFCNPYDTEREPGMSSAGSASAVAANLVTCAIGEETVVSIRWPASLNSLVGLAPTEELVSRDGMIGAGLVMRAGPICKNVEDAAKILDVIAGYDPKDELTVQSLGRKPEQPYASQAKASQANASQANASEANAPRLDGLRIGVVREYMQTQLFSKADEQSIDLVEQAVDDLRRLGATVVDPGPRGALLDACLRRYLPELLNTAFTRRFPQRFPLGPDGEPSGDHIATLLDMHFNPDLVPEEIELRSLGGLGVGPLSPGEDRYMINRYLRERGDANIKTNADLITKAQFYSDSHFPDRKAARESAERARAVDTSLRLQYRFAMQTSLLQCMQEQGLDVLVAPTSTVPPRKLTAPREPTVNGRPAIGWSFFGQQGLPVMTVPAGFTTEVWDRAPVGDAGSPRAAQRPGTGAAEGNGAAARGNGAAFQRDAATRLVGPVPARLPVGVDFIGRPFGEAVLIRVGAAYEAATHHREPPPDFGPLGQP